MPELSFTEIELRSREKPPWELGCKLRLEHWVSVGAATRSRGPIYTLASLFYKDGYWVVRTVESYAALLCGRFTLASSANPRLKTNHKIGAPKGKLP
jgi:hypothetical protein